MRSIYLIIILLLPYLSATGQGALPGEGGDKAAVVNEYFPGRQFAFVWRNWTTVPAERLAEVLGTTVGNVTELAAMMGLPPQGDIEEEWAGQGGYITVLRHNWHLLPYDQLLTLLDVSAEELAWRLKEDDFLFIKLGSIKPYCEPLHYEKPTASQRSMAGGIAASVKELGSLAFADEVPRFAFAEEFRHVREPAKQTAEKSGGNFDLRLIYPYFGTFGDPLTDPGLSSYPEGLLQRLSDVGVNGIWIHSVLRMMVPPDGVFPGAEDWRERITGLKNLVDRAAKYGIGVYLYVNEPRAMESSFFESSPQRQKLAGVRIGDMNAMCTSSPEVRQWISSSLESVFRNVPGLAGVFTITASENLTSCASHYHQAGCERCGGRSFAEIVAELNGAMAEGVLRGNPDARVLVWDWGWPNDQAKAVIDNLPKDCWLMSVSEWELPIERGGVESIVGEYSLSSVGPGPRALRHWRYAKDAGLRTVAKVQVNASWEMCVVPALPVLDLVARHADNLSSAGTDGVMLSWSLGGYPSLNLDFFQSYSQGNTEESLLKLAEKYYGERPAKKVREAWSEFSKAFEEYPYSGATLYSGPHHMGPANPFYLDPTGYKASMVGIPYDDLDGWRSVFPAEVYMSQMQKIADGFSRGCGLLREALELAEDDERERLATDLGRAEAVRIHCASTANQALFTVSRNRFYESTDQDARSGYINLMRLAAESELELVKALLPIVKHDSNIAYESSNHYFYVPQDLLEKYINLKYVLNRLRHTD